MHIQLNPICEGCPETEGLLKHSATARSLVDSQDSSDLLVLWSWHGVCSIFFPSNLAQVFLCVVKQAALENRTPQNLLGPI